MDKKNGGYIFLITLSINVLVFGMIFYKTFSNYKRTNDVKVLREELHDSRIEKELAYLYLTNKSFNYSVVTKISNTKLKFNKNNHRYEIFNKTIGKNKITLIKESYM